MFESDVEKYVIELLQAQGFEYVSAEDLARAEERERTDEVVLAGRLRRAVERLNSGMAEDVREQAVRQVLGLRKQNVIDNNEDFHRLLTEGASVEVMENGYSRGRVVRIVDFEKPESNEYVVNLVIVKEK
mgnify:CR=1 FL=1